MSTTSWLAGVCNDSVNHNIIFLARKCCGVNYTTVFSFSRVTLLAFHLAIFVAVGAQFLWTSSDAYITRIFLAGVLGGLIPLISLFMVRILSSPSSCPSKTVRFLGFATSLNIASMSAFNIALGGTAPLERVGDKAEESHCHERNLFRREFHYFLSYMLEILLN